MKAFEVEYRVKVVAHGNTAREAESNGRALFEWGNSVTIDLMGDQKPDWMGIALLRSATALRSKTRRLPDEDPS